MTLLNQKVLLIEPFGNFIRLDRCMQSIDSWGGVYRFPLNLARIGAYLLSLDYDVRFVDLQADPSANLEKTLQEFRPALCILSSGFPSFEYDVETAYRIKRTAPFTHISTFGVAPTLLGEDFFSSDVWGMPTPFDSIVTGGEPAFGYEVLLVNNLEQKIVHSVPEKTKTFNTIDGRKLFDHQLYRSPFTNDVQTYIEGSYGCPKKCTFCVVPELYGGAFSKRSPEEIVKEFQYAIEHDGVRQISLWDEGTTFQRSQIKEICEGLIELRKGPHPGLQSFSWNTRSTTALLDEEIVSLMKNSGLSGITLGIESFDEYILSKTGKGTTISDNQRAIRLLADAGIVSIGHIVLGLPDETEDSAEKTVQGAIDSGLDIAQFYCAVPYPGTSLYEQAHREGLIKVYDLTRYELCNPIMDTRSMTFTEIGNLRRDAMHRFYKQKKSFENVPFMLETAQFKDWANR